MKTAVLSFVFLSFSFISFAQSDKVELARQKAQEAIAVMDEGEYERSIEMLEECKLLDPRSYIYSYEIGLAYTFMKDYEAAIAELKKTVKIDGVNSQAYQLLGNAYSLSGQRNKALKAYKKGLGRFPDAGNLYLETGNIYLAEEDYANAIMNYDKGIEVAPLYPSNYFRLAKLFLNSNQRHHGLIYGETFMNLERTTGRTQEMSELLYQTYDEAIDITADSTSLDFCEIVITLDDIKSIEDLRLPYCAIWGKNMALAVAKTETFGLETIATTRSSFLDFYYQEDAAEYPVVLYDYHQEMVEAGVFEAYTYYLFQMGNPEEFDYWLSKHQTEYEAFVEWYTQEENILDFGSEERYTRFQ